MQYLGVDLGARRAAWCAVDDSDNLQEGIVTAGQDGRPRLRYRQAHQHQSQAGEPLWHEEGLGVLQKRHKRQRIGESTVPGDRLRSERPNHVWAFDFQFDVTDDGRAVNLLYVVDEFTREAPAMEAGRRIDGHKVVDVLDRTIMPSQVREAAVAGRLESDRELHSRGPEGPPRVELNPH